MKFLSGQDYSVEYANNISISAYDANKIFSKIDAMSGEDKINYLSNSIADIVGGRMGRNYIFFNCEMDDIKMSTGETLLSLLLFKRGQEYCNQCGIRNDGNYSELVKAFLDFNYAIHYSLSPEILGLCATYRAFYLPKDIDNPAQNKFVVNEYNVANKIINNSNIFKSVFEGFEANNFDPEIIYYFISFSADEEIYYHSAKLGNLSVYRPMSSINPYAYIQNDPLLCGNFEKYYSVSDYKFMKDYEIADNILSVK